jgi:hypothetical protein
MPSVQARGQALAGGRRRRPRDRYPMPWFPLLGAHWPGGRGNAAGRCRIAVASQEDTARGRCRCVRQPSTKSVAAGLDEARCVSPSSAPLGTIRAGFFRPAEKARQRALKRKPSRAVFSHTVLSRPRSLERRHPADEPSVHRLELNEPDKDAQNRPGEGVEHRAVVGRQFLDPLCGADEIG